MKTCIDCGIDLLTPLDEFGELGQERCQTCFLTFQWNQPFRDIEETESDIETLEDELYDLEEQVDELRSDIYAIDIQVIEKRRRIDQLRKLEAGKQKTWNEITQGALLCQS